MTTETRRSRRELVVGYLKGKRELSELIKSAPDRHLAMSLAEAGEDVGWSEAMLAQEYAGCDHDLEKACCKTRAALDPDYWCAIHTGAPDQ